MALTKIRGSQQVQNLSITNSQISLPDADNSAGILLTKIEDGSLLVKSNGSVTFSAPVSGVTPTQGAHLVTKDYADALSQGLDVKASVRAIAITNVSLTGIQVVDGVSLVDGNRVLLTGQTDSTVNGIYIVRAGAWLRSPDATTNAAVTPGMFTFVEEGTVNADTGWVLASDGATVLGTTPLLFTQFSAAGQVIGGAGLTKTGNSIDVISANGGIVVNPNNIVLTLDGPTLSVGVNGIKLANAAESSFLIAGSNGGFVSRTITGDVTITAGGVATISAGSVTLPKLASGTAGQVIVAGAGGVPTYVTVSGDATISAIGDFQLGANSVGTTELATSSVIADKIADGVITTIKLANDSVTAAKLADNAVDITALQNAAVTLVKMAVVPPGRIIMGTTGGTNTYITLSGDVTVSEAGIVTINPTTVVRVTDVIKGETPTGALNGVNLTFTLANTPKAGTVDVYVNGILQDSGAGNDYEISGNTVTLTYALAAADKIRVAYFK